MMILYQVAQEEVSREYYVVRLKFQDDRVEHKVWSGPYKSESLANREIGYLMDRVNAKSKST